LKSLPKALTRISQIIETSYISERPWKHATADLFDLKKKTKQNFTIEVDYFSCYMEFYLLSSTAINSQKITVYLKLLNWVTDHAMPAKNLYGFMNIS